MNIDDCKVWGIHSEDDKMLLDENVIAIGWHEMGDLAKIAPTREAFKGACAQVYPEKKKGAVATTAGMLLRFVHEVAVGDYVVFPSKADRMINIGCVTGGYEYQPHNGKLYHNIRKVEWLKHVPRIEFTQGARYEIGSFLTFFSVKNYAAEFLAKLDASVSVAQEDEDETVGITAEQIQENTRDFILRTLSTNLKGYDLEPFVADLLNAMGYRTMVSPHGGDGGKDIIAYKDELPPRILVQVKSTDGDIPAHMIRALKGAMDEGDYGLFVTLSNYTEKAREYLASKPIIRGINGTELSSLILKYYDKLSEKYRRMLPLKMVYIPVVEEDADEGE